MDVDNNDKTLLTDLISLNQASKESGLSRSHLALLARTGEIKAWKFGNTWLTTREAVLDYLKLNKKPGPSKKT